MILSDEDTFNSLDEKAKNMLMGKKSFQNICNLLHNQYMVAQNMKETYGNEKMITKGDKQIVCVLK